MSFPNKIFATEASWSIVLIRLMVGAVFLSEGIQKFLFPAEIGSGRFTKIGLPAPEALAAFVGTTVIICGTLILLGLYPDLRKHGQSVMHGCA